jgi:predicted metalloprotease with PDZ domain
MANRTIIRTGLITEELFLKKLEIHIGMYDYWMWAPPFQKSTLQGAVRDGGGDKDVNRPAIYNGGVVASFCLDTMIQKQTAGRRNLEDLLGLMMTRYGLAGKPYLPDDLIRDASEVAGTDFSSFFARYIASRERLPVKQCFADAGSMSPSQITPAKRLFPRRRILQFQPWRYVTSCPFNIDWNIEAEV